MREKTVKTKPRIALSAYGVSLFGKKICLSENIRVLNLGDFYSLIEYRNIYIEGFGEMREISLPYDEKSLQYKFTMATMEYYRLVDYARLTRGPVGDYPTPILDMLAGIERPSRRDMIIFAEPPIFARLR